LQINNVLGFLLTDRQTDRHTQKGKNVSSLAEEKTKERKNEEAEHFVTVNGSTAC